MQNERMIRLKAAHVFHVDPEEILIKNRFKGGRSHFTYLINVKSIFYVFRVVGKDGNLFVNRKLEWESLKKIKDLNISSETVYFDIKTGDKASVYIKGESLDSVDFHPYLDEISNLLKKTHQLSFDFSIYPGLFETLNLYESYTNLRTPQYLMLKDWWIKTYQKNRINQPVVFCHNDAQQANILIGEDQIYLLDFEYSRPNEFYYDIASFGNQKFDDALELLDVYLGRNATKEEQDIVKFYRIYQALMWYQVALRKEMIGLSQELNINFKSVASQFLELALSLYHEIKG